MASQEPGTTPDRPTPEEPMPTEPGTMPEQEPETAPEPPTMPEDPDVGDPGSRGPNNARLAPLQAGLLFSRYPLRSGRMIRRAWGSSGRARVLVAWARGS
jgi:hypothetical protein